MFRRFEWPAGMMLCVPGMPNYPGHDSHHSSRCDIAFFAFAPRLKPRRNPCKRVSLCQDIAIHARVGRLLRCRAPWKVGSWGHGEWWQTDNGKTPTKVGGGTRSSGGDTVKPPTQQQPPLLLGSYGKSRGVNRSTQASYCGLGASTPSEKPLRANTVP